MKKLSKISVMLLALLACSTFSCKKELAPVSQKLKSTSLSSSDYGRVTTLVTGLSGLTALAVDAAHNFYGVVVPYVAFTQPGSEIFKITPGGVKTLLAGGPDFGWNDGTGADAHFGAILAMTFGPDSALYALDTYNDLIRKITLRGVVTTIAGQRGIYGHKDGPTAQAIFSEPNGITSCSEGNLYVAETFNQDIRVITPGGTVYTLYGGLTVDVEPNSVASDHYGNVYFTDYYHLNIQKINTPTGAVSVIPGVHENSDIGESIVCDSAGNLYVGIKTKILKITPDGVISTLAGSDIAGSQDGIGANASFSGTTLAISRDTLYVTDGVYIRSVIIK